MPYLGRVDQNDTYRVTSYTWLMVILKDIREKKGYEDQVVVHLVHIEAMCTRLVNRESKQIKMPDAKNYNKPFVFSR